MNIPAATVKELRTRTGAGMMDCKQALVESDGDMLQAEEALKRVGLPQLHVLEGGLSGWVASGKPVRRGRERISLERQVRIAAGALAAAPTAASPAIRARCVSAICSAVAPP